MRHRRWIVALVAGVLASCGGDGPSGPGPDVRDFALVHAFVLTAEDGSAFTFTCTGSARMTVASSGTVSGTVRIDPCPAIELAQAAVVPIESGTVQGTTVTFRIVGQDVILGGVQEDLGCETVQGGEAFTGTLTDTALDAEIEIVFECDGEQVQGTFTLTWRVDGDRAG